MSSENRYPIFHEDSSPVDICPQLAGMLIDFAEHTVFCAAMDGENPHLEHDYWGIAIRMIAECRGESAEETAERLIAGSRVL